MRHVRKFYSLRRAPPQKGMALTPSDNARQTTAKFPYYRYLHDLAAETGPEQTQTHTKTTPKRDYVFMYLIIYHRAILCST